MMAGPSTRARGLASQTLRGAGLIHKDEDANMKDLTHGRKKGLTATNRKVSSAHRQRATNIYKTAGLPGGPQKTLSTRLQSLSNPLAVRGASSRADSIRLGGKSSAQHTRPLEVWREVISRRYNVEAKFLDLTNLGNDEKLRQHNMRLPGPNSTNKEWAVILKLASQLKPPVETVSLANNKIASGTQLVSLAHYLPNLKNLSLQGNEIRTYRDIDTIAGKSKKLSHLRELIFLDNPLRDGEIRVNGAQKYRSEMMRRFASLEVLDQEAVTKIAFDAPTPADSDLKGKLLQTEYSNTFPFEMAGSFITGVDGSIIATFLTRFFPAFDSKSPELADVYDPSATFSYSANTNIPQRSRIQGWHQTLPKQKSLKWDKWIRNSVGGSRNLKVIMPSGSMSRELKSLHTGAEAIVKSIAELPMTRHDVAGAAEKFCIDAWPVGQGAATMLFLCIHGEFAELPVEGLRSFDRTFILAPAAPGSRAAAANWPVSILSDQLMIRNYSSPDAWKPGPMILQGEGQRAKSAEPEYAQLLNKPDVQAALATIPEPQRSLVMTVCQRTLLNVKFSVDCLQNNAWDIERAIANFEQVKVSLNADAYLS